MAKLIHQEDYYFVEPEINSDKFWTIQLFDNDDCVTTWGRNGATGQSKKFPNTGRSFLSDKCSEKRRKGYQLQATTIWNEAKNSYVRQFYSDKKIIDKDTAQSEKLLYAEPRKTKETKRITKAKKVNKQQYQLPQQPKRQFNLDL